MSNQPKTEIKLTPKEVEPTSEQIESEMEKERKEEKNEKDASEEDASNQPKTEIKLTSKEVELNLELQSETESEMKEEKDPESVAEADANVPEKEEAMSDAKDGEESNSDAELPLEEFKSGADLELRQSSHTLQPVRPLNPMEFRREKKQPSLSQRVSASLSTPNPEHYKCKIYVKELLGSTTKKDIFELFGRFARIIDISIRPDMANPGCVSCRLQYETEADALRVLLNKDEIMQNGHRLQIAQGVRPKSRVFSSQSIILPNEPLETKLFVGGFDIDVTEEQLVKFFNHYLQRKGGDSVKNFKMIYDKRTGISRCFGFVTILNSEEQIQTLLKKKHICCYGKQIEIKTVDTSLAGAKSTPVRGRRERASLRPDIRYPSRPSMYSMSDLAYERHRSSVLSFEEAQAYYRDLRRRRNSYVEGIYSAEMIESYRRRRSRHISKDIMRQELKRQMREKMEGPKATDKVRPLENQ